MFLDFLTGAVTLLVIVLLVPFLWFVFHVSILIAIPIAVAIGLFFGLVVIGKMVRFAAGRYRESRENRRMRP
jgi:membrane protein YdbS with pleckstrin-like domain